MANFEVPGLPFHRWHFRNQGDYKDLFFLLCFEITGDFFLAFHYYKNIQDNFQVAKFVLSNSFGGFHPWLVSHKFWPVIS